MAPTPEALHRAAARLRGIGAGPTVLRLELLLSEVERQAGKSPGARHTGAVIPVIGADQAAVSSGYVVVPNDQPRRYLLADVGAVCRDDLPAHAHADLLSLELSLDGRRMLVDSGVGEYAAGP